MTGLVALCSGSGAEVHTFAESRYREQLTGVVYTGGTVELNGADGVWIPEGTPRRRLAAHAAGLQALLERGGTVLLFGDHQAGWPATVRWTYRPAGGAGDTVLPSIEHGFAAQVGSCAQQLHHHGVLDPPPGADVLLAAPDGAAVAYLDRTSTRGTLFVSTVDPLAHYGHTSDAGSRRFLDAFLPWVTDTLLTGGHR